MIALDINNVKKKVHITSGDIAGEVLEKSGLEGDVFVWHDLMYEGPRNPCPSQKLIRGSFFEDIFSSVQQLNANISCQV